MRTSKETTITVELSQNKIYFSVLLVKQANLLNKFFTIKNDKLQVVTEGGYQLKYYRGSYYIICKSIADALANSLCQSEGRFKLKAVESNGSYTLSLHEASEKNAIVRGFEQAEKDLQQWMDYLRTDFPGRIKTHSMAILEKRFSQVSL